MRVVVLGLEGSFRGHALIEECRNLGFDVDRFFGLNGSLFRESLGNYYDSGAATTLLGREMTPGEIGCAWSHQQIYKDFVATCESWLIVLEDDAVILPGFVEVAHKLHLIQDGPNVVLFQSAGGTSIGRPTAAGFRRIAHGLAGTYAYAINRDAATTAVTRSRNRVDYVADWPFRWSTHVRFWTPCWAVAGHRETESQILGRNHLHMAAPLHSSTSRLLSLITGKRVRALRRQGIPTSTLIKRELLYPLLNRFFRLLNATRAELLNGR